MVDLVYNCSPVGHGRRGTTACCGQPMEQGRSVRSPWTDGNRVITSVRRRIPVMEGIRREGLQRPREVQSHDGQEEEMDLAFCGNVMLALLSHGHCTRAFSAKCTYSAR